MNALSHKVPFTRAVVREDVFYRATEAPAAPGALRRAPCGEYELTLGEGARIAFGRRGARFSLSLDALAQHVCEGRIAPIGAAA